MRSPVLTLLPLLCFTVEAAALTPLAHSPTILSPVSQAISLAPDAAALYLQRVDLLREGRMEEAMLDYATALMLEPGCDGPR